MVADGTAVPRVRLVAAAKLGGIRWLSVLDDQSATRYHGLVAPLVPWIEGSLSPAVVANRVSHLRARPPRIDLEPWRRARRRFLSLARQLGDAPFLVTADVETCYGSIATEVTMAAARAVGAAGSDARALGAFLDALGASGVAGLPVGPAPSAVLANLVLSRGDDALRALGTPHVRWVDDWWFAAPSRSRALEALGALRAALAVDGLRLNAAKTRIVAMPALGALDVSPGGAGYHRPAHADPLPRVARADAVVPPDR